MLSLRSLDVEKRHFAYELFRLHSSNFPIVSSRRRENPFLSGEISIGRLPEKLQIDQRKRQVETEEGKSRTECLHSSGRKDDYH